MALAKKPAAVATASVGVNFLDIDNYTSGGGIPEGNYALEFMVQMYQAKKQDGSVAGPERLGVMVTAHALDDKTADPRTQFYSMGSKSHLSFAPNPETGKGLVPLPGGAGGTLNNQTNWFFFLKSMFDCDPDLKGIISNDVSLLDGIHVHLHQVPEPEERKSMRSNSKVTEAAEGQYQQQDPNRINKIAVVSEIIARPWLGEGGIPDGTEAATTAAKPTAKPAVVKPAVKPAAAVVPAADGDDLAIIANDAMTTVLESNANGCTNLAMRSGVLKAVTVAHGKETADAVLNTYFASVDDLNTILNPLGYTSDGKSIKIG